MADITKEVMQMTKLENTITKPVKSITCIPKPVNYDYLAARVKENGITERELIQLYKQVNTDKNLSVVEKENLCSFILSRLSSIDADKKRLDENYTERERAKEMSFLFSTSGQFCLGFLTYVVVPIVTVKMLQKHAS